MATQKWATPTTITTVLSTELNSLADGAYSAVGTAVDNLTNLDLYGDFELVLASLTPVANSYCALYLVKQVDGTNYEDGGGSVAPPSSALAAVFPLRAATAAQRVIVANLLLPPYSFKPVLFNKAGVALGATGNTVKIRTHNEASA